MSENRPGVVVADRPGIEAQPQVEKMSPLAIIGVRVARTYLQALLGFLGTLAFIPSVMPIPTSGYVLGPLVEIFIFAVQLAIPPAVVALLMNASELLAAVDEKYPKWRA